MIMILYFYYLHVIFHFLFSDEINLIEDEIFFRGY